MKNPNGYGSIYKLSGNRRRPFMVRKTIGWDENGKQLYQTIGYYENRSKAMQALAEFNQNPYDIEVSTITFSELYDKWKEQKFENISRSNVLGYQAAYKTAESLHNKKFVDIRTKDMQDVIRTCGKGHGTLRKIKVLYNQLYKYAMENDIVSKDYSKFVDIGKNTKGSSRKTFTEAEIERLFKVIDEIEYIDTILIMIYTGLRIGELLILKPSNINLEDRIIVGGIKTDAGKDRVIPINKKVFPLINKRVLEHNDYLVVKPDLKKMSYSFYKERFESIMLQLNFDHNPHDCRHTFATLMSNAGADTIALQKIIGHASYSTTANTYTHKDIEQLQNAVDLI